MIFFCKESMTALPAASELYLISENFVWRKPSRFVSSLERFPRRSETSRRGPELYKLTSPRFLQVLLRSSTQPVAILRQFPSRAPTCFSPTARKLEILAMPSFLRNLSQNCSEASDAPSHRCPWVNIARIQVLGRESNGAFSRPRKLLPRRNMCSCGDLDGGASLVVARRAPLVVEVGGSLFLPLRIRREHEWENKGRGAKVARNRG